MTRGERTPVPLTVVIAGGGTAPTGEVSIAGMLYVGGLNAAATPAVDPAGGVVDVWFTVRNASSSPIDATADFSMDTGIFPQRLDTVVTAILRIDPRSPAESGGEKGLGNYTIPPGNPYARDNDPKTLGEIYAHGFRNAHRLSWDPADGTMFASDIGMNHIEEINVVRAGGNYGWMAREGYWENGRYRAGELNQLWPVPAEIFDSLGALEHR